jgi:hypothetical protein
MYVQGDQKVFVQLMIVQYNRQVHRGFLITLYNITLGCVPATFVVVEKQRILHNLSVCICSLRYPACNAHAPSYHL